jgi:hypothetical protein
MEYTGVDRIRQIANNLLYLLLGIPLGVTYSLALLALLPAAALIPLLIGAPLLAMVLEQVRQFASAERALLRALLDQHIPEPDALDLDGVPPAARLGAYLGSPATWRAVIYLLLRLPVSALSGGTALLALLIAARALTAPLTYGILPIDLGFTLIDSLSKALLCALFGAGVLALLPAALDLAARSWADFAYIMLGQEKAKRLETVVISTGE